MGFKLPVLFVLCSTIYISLSILMLTSWLTEKKHKELLWWSIGYIQIFFIPSVYYSHFFSDSISKYIAVGLGFSVLSCVVGGLRTVSKKKNKWPLLFSAPFLWYALSPHLGAQSLPIFRALITLTFGICIIRELLALDKGVARATRIQTIGLTCFHIVVNLSVSLFYAGFPNYSSHMDQLNIYLQLGMMETISYSVVLGFLLLSLSKESSAAVLHRAAYTDSLTGLPNRRQFNDFCENLYVSRKNPSTLALILFDLDHFKQVNDQLGHAAGDQALKVFADIANKFMRSGELMARIGGEEFAALLPNTNENCALIRANQIRTRFEEETKRLFNRPITLSSGVSMGETSLSIEELLSSADDALYRAKTDGRNRTQFAAAARGRPA